MQPSYPYFLAIERRPLNARERAVLERLLESLSPQFASQVPELMVVGRCGCGSCPTVFFCEPHDLESNLVSYSGVDNSGNVVGAALLASGEHLSQLEFWSIDGNESWSLPEPASLREIPVSV